MTLQLVMLSDSPEVAPFLLLAATSDDTGRFWLDRLKGLEVTKHSYNISNVVGTWFEWRRVPDWCARCHVFSASEWLSKERWSVCGSNQPNSSVKESRTISQSVKIPHEASRGLQLANQDSENLEVLATVRVICYRAGNSEGFHYI